MRLQSNTPDVGGAASRVAVPGEPVARKRLLNPSKVEYATWGVNHVQGCTHDCLYCYGKTEAHQHKRVDKADWAKPALVSNAVEQVKGELARKKKPVDRVHLCFTSDPFMWDADAGCVIPEIADTTIEMIRAINEQGVPVTVLTKGAYPDLDLGSLDPRNQYGVTAVSLSEEYRQEWEPGAAPVGERLASLKRLADRGAKTWVSIEPYPTPNIDATADQVVRLLEELSFIDKFIFGRMNYMRQVTEYLKGDQDFYNRIAGEVVRWCEENGKSLHVKAGTPMHSDATAGILCVADDDQGAVRDANPEQCSHVSPSIEITTTTSFEICDVADMDLRSALDCNEDETLVVATDEHVSQVLTSLNDLEKEIVHAKLFMGLTDAAVAERHNIDEAAVSQCMDAALSSFSESLVGTQGLMHGPNGYPVGYLDNGRFVEFVPDDDNPGELSPLILRRSDDEILEAQNELWEKVWWNRHTNLVESGADLPRLAVEDAARIEAEYGHAELVLDDFGWGLTCGRLSALSWVMGSEWHESMET